MKLLPASIYFLSVEEVKEIHLNQISTYGGSNGIRDEESLASAVGQPSVGTGKGYLHVSLSAMAAAYLYHLALNHPFVDGNKRTALASALVFLDLNGVQLNSELDNVDKDGRTQLENIVLAVISKKTSKEKLTVFFEHHLIND